MAMKHKTLGFVPESNMFVGVNVDTDDDNNLGIVTFSDDCGYTAKAHELTEQTLKDDKGIQLLEQLCKTKLGHPNHILYSRSHKTRTDIWTIIWHKFLIEILEQNGWQIHDMSFIDFSDYDLTKHALII